MKKLFLLLVFGFTAITYSQKIGKDSLIQDIRKLSNTLETSHPDPYINGGGKIAFQRRLHQLISKEGMSREEFYWLLCPFIAAIGDSHTRLDWKPEGYKDSEPRGIPLIFVVADTSLYVKAVFDSSQAHLIGYRLKAVENISVEVLRDRIKHLIGFQNKYRALNRLAAYDYFSGYGYLWKGYLLKGLIPEWKDTSSITITLEKPDKTVLNYKFDLPKVINQQPCYATSNVKVPSLDKSDFNYVFADDSKKTAILSISAPGFSRELVENGLTKGEFNKKDVEWFYKRYHGWDKPVPEKTDDFIAGLPSATECFIDLLKEMKQFQTQTLIIDLRKYSGGGFALNHMLIYFLYGKEKLEMVVPKSRWVEKLSDTFFRFYPEKNIGLINNRSKTPLIDNDYFFDEDLCGWSENPSKLNSFINNDYTTQYKTHSTFWEVYKDLKYNGYYHVPNVIVICSDNTFSGGHEMMVSLYYAGAKILGSPTSQDANTFGDTLPFELINSGLKGTLSHSWYENFPGTNLEGNVLMPNYVMTYEKLAKFNFDPNAEILYAREMIGK